ncbi:MAG: hypothetical protein WCP20_16875 [Desulfuromonadales bacterium]
MKRMSVVVMALGLAVALFSIANAGNRNGMGGGCGDCAQQGAPSEQIRTFQAATIDLRQEMMNKRFELQRENLKASPDNARIASLQADIKALQSRILDIRSKSGLPVGRNDGECAQKMGGCGNKGMGGCNNGPCAAQK